MPDVDRQGNRHAIRCTECGAIVSRDIDWLRDHRSLVCSSCGVDINLDLKPIRGEIQRAWNAAHNLEPARRRPP